MEVNKNMIEGKWLEVKGNIQKIWGDLTNDELDKVKGDINAIGGLIQHRYGVSQKDYSRKLTDIFKSFEVKKDKKIDEVKKTLKK